MAARQSHTLTVLKALADGTRMEILTLLGTRRYCVGALAARLGITQGAVSQHLRIMKAAGLLTAERCGYYMHYRVSAAALTRLAEAMRSLVKPKAAEGR